MWSIRDSWRCLWAPPREVVFDIGGGIRDGKKFKAVQIGGPAGGCLPEEHLDHPMDFDSLKKLGAIIGSGGLVVMDEDTCMVEVARFFMEFTQNESCGKCVPCREGTKRMLEILDRIMAIRALSRTWTCWRSCQIPSPLHRPVRPGADGLQARAEHPALFPKRVSEPCGGSPLSHLQRPQAPIPPSTPEQVQGLRQVAELSHGGYLRPHPCPTSLNQRKCIHCGACWGAVPLRRD